jgi:hypothetical protein
MIRLSRLFTLMLSLALAVPTPAHAEGRVFPVDQAWGGTRLGYDALSAKGRVYIAYYDADRTLTVAAVDLASGKVEKKRLDSRFAGWDAHNNIVIEMDAQGRLHVAGNMHAVPLVYGRMQTAGDLQSLTLVNRMTGQDETSVTYPRFFRFDDGALGFSYRAGRSGEGEEIINRWDGSAWRRLLDQPLFAPAPGGEHVNAYHTGYQKGPDGRFHVAWVWRATPAAETTFDVMYARSADLRHWEDSRGRPYTLPITPANADVAVRVPQRNGLMNNIKLGFDTHQAPVISFIRYDSAGHTQLYHARPAGDGWQVAQATDWPERWDFSGGGSLNSRVGFSGVQIEDGRLVEEVQHWVHGHQRLWLDDAQLTTRGTLPPSPPAPGSRGTAPPPPFTKALRPVRGDGAEGVRIGWWTLPSDNNDHPRTCASIGRADGCQMSGPLELLQP